MPERFKVVCIPRKALYKCSAFYLLHTTTRQALYDEILMSTIRQAERYVAVFPSRAWIHCIAPWSCRIAVRTAAVVHCCSATPVRIVYINECKFKWYVRCIGRPRLTRSSTHSRTQCSHVHVLRFRYGLFTF